MRSRLMYLFLICALPCASGVGQWVQSNGPFGGSIGDFVICPDGASGSVLLAATPGGVFRSTDNGDSWSPSSNGLTINDVRSLLVLGTDVFVAGLGGGVFRSTDNGISWRAANAGLTTLDVYRVGIGPQGPDGRDLFAGTDYGLFRSTDHGMAWSKVNTPFSNVVGPFAVLGSHFYVGIPDGLFCTTDNGMTWTCVSCGFWQWGAGALIVSGTTLFAGTGEGVFVSSDSGTTWTQANSGLTNPLVRALAVSGTYLFAGTHGGGVFASTDNGSSWTNRSAGLTNLWVNSLLVSGTDLLAGTDNGAFRSASNGVNWVDASKGLASTYVVAFVANGAGLFAGTHGGVYFSPDNGMNWTLVNNGLPSTNITALAASQGVVYAAIYSHGIFLSTDSGEHWTDASAGLTDTRLRSLGVSGSAVLAGTEQGVFRSTDKGDSWTWCSEGLTTPYVSSIMASATALFAGTYGGGVFRSTNDGVSWTATNTGLTSNDIRCFALVGTNLFAGTSDRGVFRSTDNGTTWATASWGLMNKWISTLAASEAKLFAGTQSGGVFLSIDSGASWSETNTGLKSLKIQSLVVSGADLFGATPGSGVWRRPLSEFQPSGGPNLVKNSGFESGKSPWLFYTNGGGDFSDAGPGDGSPHAARLQIGGAGTNVQLYQPGISLEEGSSYRLRFRAYSPGGHNLRVFIHKHGAPYTNYGLSEWECDLTEGWKSFVIEFKAKNFSGLVDDARLRFWLTPYATAGDRYYIDNVVLEEVGLDPIVQPDFIVNGGFEADGKPWHFYTDGAGSFDTDPPGVQSDHSGHIRIGSPGSNVQLYQPSLELQEGARYRLTFKAYSSTAHRLDVFLHKHGAPYTNYGIQWLGVELRNEWVVFSKTFTVTNFSGSVTDGRLRFWLAPYARAGDEYFFDDISLTKESGSPASKGEILAVEAPLIHPQETVLAQNYPNPFNPVTNIQFSLRECQMTTVKVFDVLGSEVATLVNEVRGPGIHTVQFDGSALPSGVYFCRMQAGDFARTRKLILMR